MTTETRDRSFYAHLVGTAVLQLIVVVLALAADAADGWVAVLVSGSVLGLAAHGHAVRRRS